MLEPVLKADLLLLAETLARHQRVGLDTLGSRIARDNLFFRRLQERTPKGRAASFTLRKYDEVMLRFDREWPPGLVWPRHIDRPRRPRRRRETGGDRVVA